MLPRISDHAIKMHSNRTIEQDLDRIIFEENCYSVASFINEHVQKVLSIETFKANEEAILDWHKTAINHDRQQFSYTFSDEEGANLGVPIRHLGITRDINTSHIQLWVTHSVKIIVERDDSLPEGHIIQNSYPDLNRHLNPVPHRQSLLPYLPFCEHWATMHFMGKIFWRMCCFDIDDTIMSKLTYNHSDAAISCAIQEDDEEFGNILCSRSICRTIFNDGSLTYAFNPHNKNTMITKAFPQSMDAVREIYKQASIFHNELQIIAGNSINYKMPDLRLSVSVIPTVSTSETEPTKNTTVTDKKAKNRAALKAKNRSLRATKKKATKAKKPKQSKPKTTTPNIIPFIPYRVATKYETQGMSQHDQNCNMIRMYLLERIPIRNDKTGETIIWLSPFEKFQRGIVCCVCNTNNKLDLRIKQLIDDKNPDLPDDPCDDDGVFDIVKLDYDLSKEIYDTFDLYYLAPQQTTRLINAIADDAEWQPMTSDRIRKWLNAIYLDDLGRLIKRLPLKGHSNGSIIKRMNLTKLQKTNSDIPIADVDYHHLRVSKPQRRLSMLTPENPESKLYCQRPAT